MTTPYLGSVNVNWKINGLDQQALRKFVNGFFDSRFGQGNAPDDAIRRLSIEFTFYANIPGDLMDAAQNHVLEILDAEDGQYEVEHGGDQIVAIESYTGEVRPIPALTIRPAAGEEGHGNVYEATFSHLSFEETENNNNNNDSNNNRNNNNLVGGRRRRVTYRKRRGVAKSRRHSRR